METLRTLLWFFEACAVAVVVSGLLLALIESAKPEP